MDSNNKQIALEFMELITSGKIPEAYEKFVDRNGKHHNAFFPAGFPSLLKAMEDNHVLFPNKIFTPKHVVAEGDLVIIHSQIILDSSKQISAAHIFRFQDGKIVEMWDCGQMLPEQIANKDGAF